MGSLSGLEINQISHQAVWLVGFKIYYVYKYKPDNFQLARLASGFSNLLAGHDFWSPLATRRVLASSPGFRPHSQLTLVSVYRTGCENEERYQSRSRCDSTQIVLESKCKNHQK